MTVLTLTAHGNNGDGERGTGGPEKKMARGEILQRLLLPDNLYL